MEIPTEMDWSGAGRDGSAAVIDILIIAFVWCGSLVIANPLGNFPLHDDWSYGMTVKHFVESGDFRPLGWTSMPLITNVLWGSLFCLPRGFSFNALRLSTLTLSLLGVIGVYLLIRELRLPRWFAVLTALTLGFNPIYYSLSNTFMTDVPYTALMILAAVFFARTLRNGSFFDWTIGTALAVAATLSRQLGISVSLAFAASLILTRGLKGRNILRAAIPPALSCGVLLSYQWWLSGSGRLPELYYGHTERLIHALVSPKELFLSLTYNSFVALLYLGLFLLPVLIAAVAHILGAHKKYVMALLVLTCATVLLACGVLAFVGRPYLMPRIDNIGQVLTKSGIGPLTLADYWVNNRRLPAPPKPFWVAVTAMTLLGVGLLIALYGVSALSLVERRRLGSKISDREKASIFPLLCAVIYLLPLLAIPVLFDRFWFPAIPFIAASVACASARIPQLRPADTRVLRCSAIALLGAFALFAAGGTRDYLAWNRIRWEALHQLVEVNHVEPKDIDGGLEFNGLYLYDPQYQIDPKKNFWWVHDDTYKICFDELAGYEVIKEYTYFRWIPAHAGKVVVLRRIPPK